MKITDFYITDREKKRDFLLKFNGMHKSCHMSWKECAYIYEQETGKHISPDALRNKVRRAIKNRDFVKITEFPRKIVVSVQELTLGGCVVCWIRKMATKIANYVKKLRK